MNNKTVKASWFKFYPSDWVMGKIQRAGDTAQARFIFLCCIYWTKGCEMTAEDARDAVDDPKAWDQLLGRAINFDPLDELKIRIKFLDDQYQEVQDKSQKNSAAAKSRWNKDEEEERLPR